MGEYGQFCPVAKAAEVLDQRWTLLVVRELVSGSSRFNDIHRGLPRMSRTLLSRRLKSLVHLGLVVRREGEDGPVYELTEPGRELHAVVDVIGTWGMRWMRSLGEQDLDPALLVWDMHRRIDLDAVPDGHTVIEFEFPDVRESRLRRWWLLVTPREATVCDADPGHGIDVRVVGPIRTMVEVWLGHVGWQQAQRSGGLQVQGRPAARRGVRRWLQLSPFADGAAAG